MVDSFKKALDQIKPHAVVIWVCFYVGYIFLSWLAFVPAAGYLMMHLKLIRDNSKPDFNDLFGQFDNFVPLLILFLLWFAAMFLVFIPIGFISSILGKISPFLSMIFTFVAMIAIMLVLIPSQIYSILFVADKKMNAIDSLKKTYGVISGDFAGNAMLGLGMVVCMIPCFIYLPGPIGIHTIVRYYNDKIK